jgi:hypothetical protein
LAWHGCKPAQPLIGSGSVIHVRRGDEQRAHDTSPSSDACNVRDERTAETVGHKHDPRPSPNRLHQPRGPLAERGARPICLLQALRSGDGSLPEALPVGRAGIVYTGNQEDRLIEAGFMSGSTPRFCAALGHLPKRLQVAETRHDPNSISTPASTSVLNRATAPLSASPDAPTIQVTYDYG